MIELLIIVCIFVLSYILVLKDFKFSLYVLLVLSVLLHKELFSFYRWDLMPVRAFMLAVFCAGITHAYIGLIKKRESDKIKTLFSNPFLICISLLWLVRGISIIFTKNFQASALLFGFFSTVVVLMFFIYHNFKSNPQKILSYLDFYIYLVFGLTIFGYFQYFLYAKTGVIIGALWNIPGNIPRVGASFWDVNHYGALLAGLLPFIGVRFLSTASSRKRLFYVVSFLSMLLTLLLTNSRTAWIIALFSFLVFVTLILTRKFGYKGLVFIFGVFVLISIPLVKEYSNPQSLFRAKIKHYFHYRIDSFDSHFMLLQGTYQIFEKYPVLGGGYGSFFEHFSKTEIAPTYFGRDPAALNTRVPAHTIWGELIAETGVLGLSVFLLLTLLVIFTLYTAFIKGKKWKEYIIPAAMLSVIVGWLSAGIFYSYNAEFFWIILCFYFTYGVAVVGEKYLLKNMVGRTLKSRSFYRVVLLLLSVVILFVNLGKTHLIPWDEAIYAKISKNMVLKNEYGTQYWWSNRVWYEKPPLYMWFTSLVMRVVGFTSFSARLTSAFFGLATVFIVYYFGKKMFNKTVGFIAGLALLTTVHFVQYSRAAMLDVSVTFFITLSLYLYYSAKTSVKKKNLWWLFSGVCMGLAVMTKGVIGFLPLPVIFLHESALFFLRSQRLSKDLVKGYVFFALASLMLLAPWHLYMYKKFGNAFINNYIGYHVISRATEDIEDKVQPFWWYIIVLKVSMRLWFVALLAAFPFAFYTAIKKNTKYVFLIIWSVFIFLFFSVAKSKLQWYIIPLYPSLALIVGCFLERMLDFIMGRIRNVNNVIFKFVFLYVFVIFMLMYFFSHRNLAYPSDTTGSQARLLQLKDDKFGVDQKVYVDRIELPLVLFYTDGPFHSIDFNPAAGRYPIVTYVEKLVILGKRGRFSVDIPEIGKKPDIAREDGDYILWSYESDYALDKEELNSIEDKILEYAEEPQTPAVLAAVVSLQRQKMELTEKIDTNLADLEGQLH